MVTKLAASRPTVENISSAVSETVNSYHSNIIQEVIHHVEQDDIVVVGMAWNPFVQRAQRLLDAQQCTFTYLTPVRFKKQ